MGIGALDHLKFAMGLGDAQEVPKVADGGGFFVV